MLISRKVWFQLLIVLAVTVILWPQNAMAAIRVDKCPGCQTNQTNEAGLSATCQGQSRPRDGKDGDFDFNYGDGQEY